MLKTGIPDYVREVCNPYTVADSPGRRGIMVGGPWDDAIYAFIREIDARALYINISKGWRGTDFGFLSQLDTIEELNIITSRCEHLDALEQMSALQSLQLTCDSDSTVDFTKLTHLSELYLYWWPGASSVLDATQLEKLYLDEARLKDFAPLGQLTRLRYLTIANANISGLAPLSGLENLERLELLNCRKLSNFDALGAMTSLKRLTISGCKALQQLDLLSTLKDLEVLVIADNGSIESLVPLADLKKLKALSFAGNTTIADGDLTLLTELPHLAMLMFASRRHYSHKLIKPWNWNNFEQPDTLLAEKKAARKPGASGAKA